MFKKLLFILHYSFCFNSFDRTKIINKNKGLVHYFEKKYSKHCFNKDDLLQEGMYGLIKAADKFDHTRNIAFSTYASYWIRSYMIKHIHNEKHIRIPSEKRKQNVKRFVHFLDTFHEYDEISKDNNNNEQNLTIY